MPGPSTPTLSSRTGLLSPVSSSHGPIKSILRMPPSAPSSVKKAVSTVGGGVAGSRNPLKRKLQDDECPSEADEASTQASSQGSKRQKTVHFDLSLNITTEVGRRTLGETQRSVRHALETHATGDDLEYIELQDVFANDREPHLRPVAGEPEDCVRPEELVLYIVALTNCTPLLNKSCTNLVTQILACSWIGRDDKFFRAYVQFLAALISSHGGYLRPVLDMMVDQFLEPRSSSWQVPDFPSVDRETAQKRLHFGLEYVLQLFPAARSAVGKLIAQKYPFPGESRNIYLFYLDNVLRVREYAPKLGPELLETVTSNLVRMDTEFQLDLSDMDDDLVSRVLAQLSAKEGDALHHHHDDDDEDDDEDEDSDSEADDENLPALGEPDYDEEANQIEKSTRLVQKLDASLERLFALFAPAFEDPDTEAARQCLGDMLSDFVNFVLTVPSSRHTQFLVFHFSQRSLPLQDLFTGTLLNLGFESNRPATVRQAAASYLSSFVARAARVPRETVRSVVGVLCMRMDQYRRSNAEGCRGPDLRRYQELYAWVQALLYIFCFRWRDLVDAYPDIVDPEDPASFVGQELEWMPGLKQTLTSVIYSVFNPLMVCSPAIVSEFAKLAHSMRFMYVFPRLESNKSIHLSQFVSGHYGAGGALREDAGYTVEDEKRLQLEGNFPFDPYLLPTSKRWLDGDYIQWTSIAGVSGFEDDDSDEESGDEEAEAFEEDTATDVEDEA